MPSVWDSSHFTFTNHQSLIREDIVDVTVKEELAPIILFLAAISFQNITLVQIVSSWLSLLTKLQKEFPMKNIISPSKLNCLVKVITFTCLITFASLAAIGYITESVILVNFIAILLVIAFSIGLTKFEKMMKTNTKISDNKFETAIKLVKTTARTIIICLILMLLFIIVHYALLLNYLAVLDKGQLNYIVVLKDAATVCILIIQTRVAIYVDIVTERLYPSVRRRSKSIELISQTDTMKLMPTTFKTSTNI